jgi:predicted O-linked N-acetylglucosamine transferase (SPINDLY family)
MRHGSALQARYVPERSPVAHNVLEGLENRGTQFLSKICCDGGRIFDQVMPKIEHLKRLTLADVYLDTLVYNGHTTGSDVLWAGVPMVTIQGDTFPSRVGASLARAIEMPEMIATTMEEYVDKAVELGTDPAKLRAMRERLEGKRLSAPLFDTKRWVESFEDALQTMWSNHEVRFLPSSGGLSLG